jgi:plastocyanin
MMTLSPLFVLGIKALGLTTIAAIIFFSANVAIGTTQQVGEPQVESDGGLTATLNGEGFRRGDTITVSGGAESEASSGPTITFQDTTDGFRVQVPNGWVVENINTTDLSQQYLRQYDVERLAEMCPQNQALPVTGGLYSCSMQSPTAHGVLFYRFVDLQTMPELAALARENKSITTNDLLALFIEFQRKVQDPRLFQDLEIVNNTDFAVNVIDSQTNETIGTAPTKHAEYAHTDTSGRGSYKDIVLLALSNDTNTGYFVVPIMLEGLESDREAPAFVRQVLDSFELVTPTTPIATTSLPPQGQPQQKLQSQQQEGQQKQLQQQQNQGASVSITSGSSAKTTDAFQPNPAQVSIGATVTWTNDDSQPHTVTAGENATSDQQFNSDLMAPAATFSHTFTEPGDYPYFCLIHPNMVGEVSVG